MYDICRNLPVILQDRSYSYNFVHCVCPFVRMGSVLPLSRKRMCAPPPPEPKGGRQHSPSGEGVDGPNSQFGRQESKPGTLSCSLCIGQYVAPRILHLAPRIPVPWLVLLIPYFSCPLNTKSSIWLVLPDSINKTLSF